MENKYYTPELHEFHIGFEFEEKIVDDLWKSSKFLYRWFEERYFLKQIDNKNIRVKYLDREDIESLGWEYSILAKRYFLKSVGLDNDEINSGKGIWLFHTGIIEDEIPDRWIIIDC